MSLILFGPDQLQAAITEALPTLPDGHQNALVGTVDATGAQVVVMIKRDVGSGEITASGIIKHTWTGDTSAGAQLVYSW